MWRFYTSLAVVFLFAAGGAYLFAETHSCYFDIYSSNARTPLFTAFVTLGSFLLTLKTTILQRLKEGFDSPEHEKRYLYVVANGIVGDYYASLFRMSSAIATCVVLSLISSLGQMTIGFIRGKWSFALCVAFPATTLLAVLYLWLQIVSAHTLWLKSIETKKQSDLSKRKTAASNDTVDE
jgi:hypothetical protein